MPTPPRDDPVCLAGEKGRLHLVGESRQLTSARRAHSSWPVASAYRQVPVGLAVCKTNVSVRQVEVNDERMQPIAGSWLRPGRGNEAPGLTDPPRSCAQHMKSPTASSLAGNQRCPGLCSRQATRKGQKSPQNSPCPDDQPLRTQTRSPGQQYGPMDTAPSHLPAMPSRRLVKPARARLPSGDLQCCDSAPACQVLRGQETDSAQGKPTFGGGQC